MKRSDRLSGSRLAAAPRRLLMRCWSRRRVSAASWARWRGVSICAATAVTRPAPIHRATFMSRLGRTSLRCGRFSSGRCRAVRAMSCASSPIRARRAQRWPVNASSALSGGHRGLAHAAARRRVDHAFDGWRRRASAAATCALVRAVVCSRSRRRAVDPASGIASAASWSSSLRCVWRATTRRMRMCRSVMMASDESRELASRRRRREVRRGGHLA